MSEVSSMLTAKLILTSPVMLIKPMYEAILVLWCFVIILIDIMYEAVLVKRSFAENIYQ